MLAHLYTVSLCFGFCLVNSLWCVALLLSDLIAFSGGETFSDPDPEIKCRHTCTWNGEQYNHQENQEMHLDLYSKKESKIKAYKK